MLPKWKYGLVYGYHNSLGKQFVSLLSPPITIMLLEYKEEIILLYLQGVPKIFRLLEWRPSHK